MRLFVTLLVYLLLCSPVGTLPPEEPAGSSMDGVPGVRELEDSPFLAEAFQVPELPIQLSDGAFKPLESCRSKTLQNHLNKELLRDPVFARLISSRKLCLGLVDLSDWKNPRYASINGKEMMYAASLPKIAVLLAVEDAIHKGEVEETPALREDMNQMIRFSNNAATSRIIELLGYEKIEAVLRDPQNQFYSETDGGGLWVGKMYSRSGQTNREPMKNLSHAANVFQVSRFYYRLAFGKLVSYDRSADMLEVMKDPGLKHKFVHTLEQIAPKAALYRKSGSWKSWHSDSILVWDTDRKYILVALTEDPGGEQIVRSLVRPVEKVLTF
jgi:beta-lactamase class A